MGGTINGFSIDLAKYLSSIYTFHKYFREFVRRER